MIKCKKGLTLIELLVAISITTILTGVVLFMMNASFDSYFLVDREITVEKALDEALENITGGDFKNMGISDALEILSVEKNSITFVPLWVDESHRVSVEHCQKETFTKHPFILNRPFRGGASIPMAEVMEPYDNSKLGRWHQVPVIFQMSPRRNTMTPGDKVFLLSPLKPGSRIRFVYEPDGEKAPDTAMTIKYKDDVITRSYRGKVARVVSYGTPGIVFSALEFKYYDNACMEVEPKKELIPNITAVKVSVRVSLFDARTGTLIAEKTGTAFINIRNTHIGGRGLIIREGTRVRLPNSKDVRVFSLANIAGVEEDDVIEIETISSKGKTWKAVMTLGFKDDNPVIKRYSIEYPSGNTLYSETINQTTDIPFSFMDLGGDGRFDYNYDKNTDVVNLEGDVILYVRRMDAGGAALYIRP